MISSKDLLSTSSIYLSIYMDDLLTKEIINTIKSSDAPLETFDIVSAVQKKDKTATRAKIMLRLRELKGSKINGKLIGSGKGVWIWWK